MALYIGFRVQLYDGTSPNSNLIADLGAVAYPILTWTANAPDGFSYQSSNYYSAYVSDADKMGGVSLGGDPNYYEHASSYAKLLEIAPLAVERLLWGQPVNGNYLRLVNVSGYYATHDIALGSAGSVGLNCLYDNEGRLLSNSLGFQFTQYGFADSSCLCVCLSAIISNGNISRIKQNFCLRGFPLNNSTYYVQTSTYSDVDGDKLAYFFNHCEQYVENMDPYSGGGNSDIGGGAGDFDDTSDPIDFPALPSIGAVDSGFITIFNPTINEVKSLATYMWTNPLFDLTTWKKIFADPMDAILGLSLIPVSIPDGGSRAIKVGNIATDVTMNVAATQFIEIQCGAINVNEYWGAYLDYSPYTKVEIYLPYCGAHQLSIDDVMGKTVEVRYHVDILSGACCAYVKCGESVLYTFLGQCSSSIPIAANDFTNVINGVLSAAVSIGSMVATGGMTAPLAVPGLASTAVNSMKENVEKSGAISGTGGILAIQKPYIILTRPRQALPTNQNQYTGYPSFITSVLSDLSGYTEIEQIHLHDIPATDGELSEIESLLKTGVIL